MAEIKYRWWVDRPKNVSRREYERYNLVQFGTIALGGLSALCFIAALMNLFTLGSQPWGDAQPISVSDALSSEGDRTPLMLQGRLITDPPSVMPDDPSLSVVAGDIQLTVSEEGLEPATLWQWRSPSENIFLEQDQKRIPFKLDPTILPMEEDRFTRPDLIYEGESVRFRKLVAVEYNGDRYPLPEAYLNLNETPTVNLNRQYFINGQNVVLVAGIDKKNGEAALVPPLGQQAQLWVGTPDGVASQKIKTIPMLIIFGAGSAIACYFLSQKYFKLREEIVRKSNA